MANNVDNPAYIEEAQRQSTTAILFATIETAIDTALALWKRKGAKSIANMQDEIAQRQVALAEMVHAHAMAFWPHEMMFVADAFGIGKATPTYSALATSWASRADDTHQAYQRFFEQCLNDRCICLTACERANWTRNRQKDRAQIMYFADRQAEGRADALNDQRYAKQYAALGLGRGKLASIPSFQEVAGATGNNARSLLMDSINKTREAYGYFTRANNWGDTEKWKETKQMPYDVDGGAGKAAIPSVAPGATTAAAAVDRGVAAASTIASTPSLPDYAGFQKTKSGQYIYSADGTIWDAAAVQNETFRINTIEGKGTSVSLDDAIRIQESIDAERGGW